ncbi:MAG: hypothetical protein ACTHM7_16475 [Ginsengibacter sp.]
MYSKEEAHSQIAALVERFTEQLPSYKKSDYNETLTYQLNTRIEYTDEKINKLVFELYGLREEEDCGGV